MAVQFNPAINRNNNVSFGKQPKLVEFGPIDRQLSSEELSIKRTKKAIFEASGIVVGVCLLYFKLKKHFLLQTRIENEVKQYELLRRRREAKISI